MDKNFTPETIQGDQISPPSSTLCRSSTAPRHTNLAS